MVAIYACWNFNILNNVGQKFKIMQSVVIVALHQSSAYKHCFHVCA